jgi:hypothetical protein
MDAGVKLDAPQIKRVAKEIFNLYDDNDSGYLERAEIKQIWTDLMNELGKGRVPEDQLDQLITKYDINGDGEFSMAEVKGLLTPIIEQELKVNPRSGHLFFRDIQFEGKSQGKFAHLIHTKLNNKQDLREGADLNPFKLPKKLCPQIFMKPPTVQSSGTPPPLDSSSKDIRTSTDKRRTQTAIESHVKRLQDLKSFNKISEISGNGKGLGNWELQLAKSLHMKVDEIVSIDKIDENIKKFAGRPRTLNRENTSAIDKIGDSNPTTRVNSDPDFGEETKSQ